VPNVDPSLQPGADPGEVAGPIMGIDDLPAGPLFVFAYGSLLWRPGFEYLEAERARIHGFHRALRVWSYHHRGTPQQPGLVLGLDAGGSCLGTIYKVAPSAKQSVAEYLWAREMVTSVYIPRLLPVRLTHGSVAALAFVLDRRHTQYAGGLDAPGAAAHIRSAQGASGANPEYVRETVAGLQRLGVHDRGLSEVLRHLDAGARSGRSER
jgi:cation transport protein ChaC